MENNRLNDMVERYGEVCSQKTAAKILNVGQRTVFRMLEEGRLRRVDHRVDVRSICEYIENPKKVKFNAEQEQNRPRTAISQGDFMAVARRGRWAQGR